MERIIYNRKKMEGLAIQWMQNQHPDWPREKCVEEGLKEECIEELTRIRMAADLADAMIGEDGLKYFPHDFFRNQAGWIMDHAPKELYQNINEFIDGKEFTDIKINGMSVLDIMNLFENRKIDFVSAIECMCYWKIRDYKDKDYCRKFFARR